MEPIRSTTIICVRLNGSTVIGGDGQVSQGDAVIMKHNTTKIRRLYKDNVLAGFAGSTADSFTLFELFEKKLQEYNGHLVRAAVEFTKNWRTERALRQLQALLVVANHETSLLISGDGNVIEPENHVIAVGSGGFYAQAAALALLTHTSLSAREIVESSLKIAADICVYTNHCFTIDELTEKKS